MTISVLTGLMVLWAAQGALNADVKSARYYDERNQFSRALPIWEEVTRRQPRNLVALKRTAELRLLLQGREPARQLLAGTLGDGTSPRFQREVLAKLEELHERFLRGEAQSFYLQAQARAVRGDCRGALGLISRGLAVESDNFRLLEIQSGCQRNLKDWGGWLQTVTRMSTLVPGAKREEISELHFYFGRPSKALRVVRGTASVREKLVLGAALVELGRVDRAVEVLSSLPTTGLGLLESRARNYFLGRALVEDGQVRRGVPLLRAFVADSFRSPTQWDWDPYRLEGRLASARKLSRISTDR